MAVKNGPTILLELNELCPPILQRMMARDELPNFRALHAKSDVFVTHTDDESLEPWVQWVTLHTGKGQSVHGARELDEGHLIQTTRLWDKLAEQGLTSLIFGSMNGDTTGSEKVFLFPDPWSAGVKATDPNFQSLHDFIGHQVKEHTNPDSKPGLVDMAKVGAFLASHGLSLKTVSSIVGQLTSEKTKNTDLHWRRAIILDLLLWDVFESSYKKRRPDFATFFANSTAFLQHRYWRHMEPDAYEVKPSRQDLETYGGAIEESYRHMDDIVGRAVKLAGPNGRIIFATALSQEANLRYEHIGGKFVYRPTDFTRLFQWAGAPPATSFEPVMTHQTWASYDSESDAVAAEAALDRITSNGKTIMEWQRDGNRIMFWCGLISQVEDGFQLTQSQTGEPIAFSDLFMSLGQVNNSQHHSDGCFWLPSLGGKPQVHSEKLALEDTTNMIMNTVLDGRRLPAETIAA